jgi:hypothetical protein
VFALLDRHQIRIGIFDNWQPAKLAPVKEMLKIKRGESLFELIVGALFISWWVGLLQLPAVIYHDGIATPFKLSEAWQLYWWGILLLSAMDIVLAAINFLQPYWTRDRLLLRVLLNAVSIALCYTLFQHDVLVVLADPDAKASLLRLTTMINQFAHGSLVVLALIAAGEIVQDIRRLLQLR